MYCAKCGTRNEDSATTCIQCGNALRPPSYGTPMPPAATPPPPPQAPPPSALPPQQQYPQAPIAQSYTQPPPMAQQIPNYLIQAILVTVFCCLPFGIVSIIFAAQVNSKAAVGDIAGAMQASKQAKLWAWVAFGFGAVSVVLGIVMGMLGVLGGFASHAH